MTPNPADFQPLGPGNLLSWVHFGDLHLTTEDAWNYLDLGALIADANLHLSGPGGVNFAFLPGDNADDGTEAQYEILVRALEKLDLPLHVLPGDHDIQSGNLDLFKRFLEASLPKSFVVGGRRCVFLNSVDIEGKEGFGHGTEQLAYLTEQLWHAAGHGEQVILFMHTYPSELGEAARTVTDLIRGSDAVRVVEMGHTHYNEIANDGRILYAATRSTGQIEEGPVGFSVTCLDGDVVSWKFKELAAPWPFVVITSPADEKFLTRYAPPVRQPTKIHAKAWSASGVVKVWCRIDQEDYRKMEPASEPGLWSLPWNPKLLPDGPHRLTVWVVDQKGGSACDTINVLIDHAGNHQPPPPRPVDMDNRIGAYPAKGIPGTLLGPNLRGHPW